MLETLWQWNLFCWEIEMLALLGGLVATPLWYAMTGPHKVPGSTYDVSRQIRRPKPIDPAKEAGPQTVYL